MGNILHNSLDVTYEDFLKSVFGMKPKPEWNALKSLFSEIVTGKSTLVSDLSKPLRENASKAECKRVQERVSGWLGNYDFVEATGGWLLKNIPEDRLDGCTFAVDFSDISKVFGGEGMEGMAMGRDGSTGEIRMGHDFICVSLVGADYPEALPVYVKLGRGRKSHDELISEAVAAVMERTGGKGWIVEDRGMDGAEHLWTLKRDDRKAVVRVNKMDRDVFGTGRTIDKEFAKVRFVKAELETYRGTVKARVKWKPGVFMDECGNKKKVLVVESCVGGHAIWLYVTCPDSALEDESEMERLAILAAQAYRNRWQIERSFETVKQEFSLEKLRVRTFRRLKNVFSLCVVAYLFVTRYLRASSRFKGIVKAIRDNCTEQSLRTHPLLANLRSLIGEERIRNITGRPRKPPEKEPDQLEFAFPDAA